MRQEGIKGRRKKKVITEVQVKETTRIDERSKGRKEKYEPLTEGGKIEGRWKDEGNEKSERAKKGKEHWRRGCARRQFNSTFGVLLFIVASVYGFTYLYIYTIIHLPIYSFIKKNK